MKFRLFDGQELDLTMDPSVKHFILLSGGLDSAVLLYCLALVGMESGVVIQPVMVEDGNTDAPEKGKEIVDYVNGKLGTTIPYHIPVGDITVHHTEKTKTGVYSLLVQHGMDIVIWQAITKNPPVVLGPRDFSTDFRPVRKSTSGNNILRSPFYEYEKTYIVGLMRDLGILSLAAKTLSCTNTSKGNPPCGGCFQCLERNWAFRSINLSTKPLEDA